MIKVINPVTAPFPAIFQRDFGIDPIGDMGIVYPFWQYFGVTARARHDGHIGAVACETLLDLIGKSCDFSRRKNRIARL